MTQDLVHLLARHLEAENAHDSIAIVVAVRDGLMATERLYWDARTVLAQLQD